jgi:hypothetical protein
MVRYLAPPALTQRSRAGVLAVSRCQNRHRMVRDTHRVAHRFEALTAPLEN